MKKLFESGQEVHIYSNNKRINKDEVITVVGYWDEDLELKSSKEDSNFVWNPKNVYAVGEAPDFDIENSFKGLASDFANLETKFNKLINLLPTGSDRENVTDANILTLRAKAILTSLIGK